MVSYNEYESWFNKYYCVYWDWYKPPYWDSNYYWRILILPCVGGITFLDGRNKVRVISAMGNERVFFRKQVKFFDTEKKAQDFVIIKRLELNSRNELF